MKSLLVICVFLFQCLEWCYSLSDAKTPPMGFNSWNAFKEDVNEIHMINTVNAFKKLNLDKFGYKYVIIDDFWSLPNRSVIGKKLQVNSAKFPRGMEYISDYIHRNGLKFGIYANAGYKTCGGMAGSLGFERQDLEQFLDWNIDYLKYDNCYPNDDREVYHMDKINSLLHFPSMYQYPDEKSRFKPMAEAIKVSNRSIIYELCLYGWGNVEDWGKSYGSIWRTAGDIKDRWPSLLANIDINDSERFVKNQGRSKGWNYPDALFIGKGGMTNIEYKTMFTLWSIVKSPLMLGTDLSKITKHSEEYKVNMVVGLKISGVAILILG